MKPTDSDEEARLRLEAENRLESGVLSHKRGSWTLGVDALSTLYNLARSKDSAADARRLLHELQVHQVELELQQDAILAAEEELAANLAHYRKLYDLAPLGYFVTDPPGRIIDVNQAGARLLGTGREAVLGRHLAWFLDNHSRPALKALLSSLPEERDTSHCEVRFNQTDQPARVTACLPPGDELVLMLVIPLQQGPAQP